MRIVCSVIVLYSSLVLPARGFSQDKAREIVERAIVAQGGKSKIAKLRCMRIKVEGTTDFVPGHPNLPFTIEDMWQMPDRYKTSSTIQFNGEKHVQTEVINGSAGWSQLDGVSMDLPKEALAEMKEQKYAEDFDRFGFLKDKNVELSTVADITVNGKPAAGILIKSKGHRDVKLYFDKATGLLVKREHRLPDTSPGRLVLQEVLFSDYQDKDGLKHYRKLVLYRDGKKVVDARVTEIEFFDKLDAKAFAKP